ncbi:hypothetical protein JCM10908_001513 [Rhodotorula pacifica]|uniref:uncharacterized protein n=1 Tax=Rhodotorula pacifica TaxID=1495444 RepID=UPI00317B4BE6
MFYDTEILTSRKGGFAVFWLAATVGSRGGTAVRKLSKKELLSCNVVQACEKVIQPEEPLALRLSSNLMMGIARVFSQQYTIYASDVQQVHAALKKIVSDAVASAPDTTLVVQDTAQWNVLPQQAAAAVAKEAAGGGGINLSVNAGLTFVGYDPDLDLGLEWRLPGEEEPEKFDEIDEPPLITPDISILGSPVAKQRKPHQAREEDIKLHEPHLDDYLLKQGEQQDNDLGGEDLGFVFEEGEQGLLEGIHPDLDAVIHASSAASGRGSARGSQQGGFGAPASSSAVGFGEDLGGFDQQNFDQDFGGGWEVEEQGMDVEGEIDMEEKIRREVEAARARWGDVFGFSRSATPFDAENTSQQELQLSGSPPSSATQKRISTAVAEAQNKAAEQKQAAQRPKKPKRMAIDRNIDMEGAKIRDMRQTYGARMRVEREKADRLKDERAAHDRAVELVFGAPPLLIAPAMTAFWNSEVVAKMAPFEGNKALAEKKRLEREQAAQKGASRADTAEPEGGRRVASGRLSEQPEGAAGNLPFEADFGVDFFANNQDFGGEGFGAMEGDMGGFDQFQFDEEVELGRAASATGRSGSQRASALPWAAEPATSDVGGAFGGDFGGASSAAGGSKVSLEAGVEQPMRSRSPSLLPSPGRGGSVDGLLEDDVNAASAGRGSGSPRASGIAMEEPALAENESLKFLSYAHRQASTVPAGQPLYFSTIVPETTTAPSVAAQALYHLLGLATKGMVKVDQPIAYGEIAVELK